MHLLELLSTLICFLSFQAKPDGLKIRPQMFRELDNVVFLMSTA